jgi:hypothetical protein
MAYQKQVGALWLKNKQNENSPDYRMILSQPLPQPTQEHDEVEPEIEDDDVPF